MHLIGIIDKTLFAKKIEEDIISMHIYVDNVIYAFTSSTTKEEFIQLMKSPFEMSIDVELTFSLFFQVKQLKYEIFVSLDKYSKNIW